MQFWTNKVLVLILIVSLFVGILSACTDSDGSGVDADKSDSQESKSTDNLNVDGLDEPITLTFVRSTDDTMELNIFSKLDETWDDNRWSKLYKEELGIEIKYNWIAQGDEQYTQKFNAAIATGDIPDIVSVDKTKLKELVEADLIMDISPYYEEYASDLLRTIVDEGGERAIQAATFDNVQYGIPIVDCDLETAQMLWIRQDWLEQTGENVPTTIDELVELMKKFNNIAGDEAVGLHANQDIWGSLKGFFQGYKAYPTTWIKTSDGILGYGNVQPEIKEALAKLAELYKEGLLDQEFMVKDGTKAAESIASGKNGLIYGWHALALWPLQDNINNDNNADWLPYPIVIANADQELIPGLNMMTGNWYAINKDCKHPEALIKMLNLYCEKVYDEEKQEYEYYANPGDGLEGVWRLSPVFMNTASKNQMTANNLVEPLKNNVSDSLWGEQLTMYEYCQKALDGDQTHWGWNRVFGEKGSQQLLLKYQDEGSFIYDEFYGAPTKTMVEKKTTLDAMLDETFIKIIAGQIPIDEFDNVVKSWESSGGKEMTDEVNQWYSNQD